MSFPNYESYPGQQGPDEGVDFQAGGGPSGVIQPQSNMSANPTATFQIPGAGGPGSVPGDPQSGDSKTTLWYDSALTLPLRSVFQRKADQECKAMLTLIPGWESWSRGLTKILSAAFGTEWVKLSVSR